MTFYCKHYFQNGFQNLYSILFLLLCTACSPSEKLPLERWQHTAEGSYAANISNDGTLSVVSSIHHGVNLWNLNNNALLFNWNQKQENSDNLVLAVDIADNNSHVVTASKNTFSLWNAQTGQSEGYWKIRESSIRDIAVSSNGNYVLIGKGNGTVVHVNIQTGRRLEFLGHQEKINAVDLLPNGRVALSGGNDFVAYVWDTKTGQVVYRFNHPSRVTMVALDPKGRFAFTADSKKTANIWDLKTGKRISQLSYTNRQEIFSAVSFSPDGEKLATGAPSRKVSLWDINSGKRLTSWRVSPKKGSRPAAAVVYSVAFRDNNHLLTHSSSGYAELWQTTQ